MHTPIILVMFYIITKYPKKLSKTKIKFHHKPTFVCNQKPFTIIYYH